MNPSASLEERLRACFTETKTIAVVGYSNNPMRASNYVSDFLAMWGYDIYPVNPGLAGQTISGRKVYGTLADVPVPIDMVDVFRNSEAAAGVVDEALALPNKPKVIWMQLGVRHDEAAAKAKAQGVEVFMDRCPKIDLPRLGIGRRG